MRDLRGGVIRVHGDYLRVQSSVGAEAALVLFSIAYAIFPMGMITGLPILYGAGLPRRHTSDGDIRHGADDGRSTHLHVQQVGTILGLFKCCMNIGATALDPVLGLLQDRDPSGGYDAVLGRVYSAGSRCNVRIDGVSGHVVDKVLWGIGCAVPEEGEEFEGSLCKGRNG